MKQTGSSKYSTPFQFADGYKFSHPDQYPKDICNISSGWTPRKSRLPGVNFCIFFGLQYTLSYLNSLFERDFFSLSKEEAVEDFVLYHCTYMGYSPSAYLIGRIESLHGLGSLPLSVQSLPEGTKVPIGVPMFTIRSSSENHHWLVGWAETFISNHIWQPCTVATISYLYKQNFVKYCKETSDLDFLPDFQGHDFSLRGLNGMLDAGDAIGAAHLLSSFGTDNCPSLNFVHKYYNPKGNELPEKYLIGCSVPATEHSVAQAGGEINEDEYIQRMLDLYPKGIVSVVADTWDFWGFITNLLPRFKDQIMAREGKFVVRPDSSPKTPVEIIIGDPEAPTGSPEYKGAIECLYEIFGGTKNSKGFIELDSHIGLIYGDSITLGHQEKILEGLKNKGFSSTSVVLGIGSYTYQYITRDTFGMAFKETAVKDIQGNWIPTWKDPKTDTSGKKSARGLLQVRKQEGELTLVQEVPEKESGTGELTLSYFQGEFVNPVNFQQIREKVKGN